MDKALKKSKFGLPCKVFLMTMRTLVFSIKGFSVMKMMRYSKLGGDKMGYGTQIIIGSSFQFFLQSNENFEKNKKTTEIS